MNSWKGTVHCKFTIGGRKQEQAVSVGDITMLSLEVNKLYGYCTEYIVSGLFINSLWKRCRWRNLMKEE